MTDEFKQLPSTLPAAGIYARLAAMTYEAVLLCGVVFAVGYVLLALMQWSYPLPPVARASLQAAVFVVIGAYFVVSWTRSGQTLALRSWHLKVVDVDDRAPRHGRAIARYLLAWHLWLPGLAIAGLYPLTAGWTLVALAVTLGLLLIPPLIDRQRRLLHDFWSGTRIVRVPSGMSLIRESQDRDTATRR